MINSVIWTTWQTHSQPHHDSNSFPNALHLGFKNDPFVSSALSQLWWFKLSKLRVNVHFMQCFFVRNSPRSARYGTHCKKRYKQFMNFTSLLREIAYHMRSHSVTCHLAEVTFPPLPQPKLVLDLVTPKGCKAELTWVVVAPTIVTRAAVLMFPAQFQGHRSKMKVKAAKKSQDEVCVPLRRSLMIAVLPTVLCV